ncbi:MAG: ATP-dependent DNA helicase PcrA, partial [Clostridiales bacterium]
MDLSLLNERQREAVLYTEGALLIMAGAGSGKTRVLTKRIEYLISEKNVRPYQILALTFTNKAANEMKERLRKNIGDAAMEIYAGTFHSICAKILRRYADRLGYNSNFVIYDSSDQLSLIKNIMKENSISDKEINPKNVKAKISNAKNSLTTVSEYEEDAFSAEDFAVATIYRLYEHRLREYNAMDFDDLIVNVIELFKTDKEVLKKYSEQFRYVNVDEYQDTNSVQYVLVSLFSSFHKNICVVGDQDQSIYSWRGADIRNITDFEKDFEGAKTILLEQNYRSTKNILG